MTVAIQRSHLKSKPYLPRKREAQGRIRWITPEEEAKMLQIVSQWGMDGFYDVVVCLVDTGFRISELRGLSFRDIDFTTNMVTTGTPRMVTPDPYQ
jgi:integrase